MSVTVITPPTVEPVTVDDVRHFGNISKTDVAEIDSRVDGVIAGLLAGARKHIENNYLNRALMSQTLRLTLDSFKNSMIVKRDGAVINLPRAPVQSVEWVKLFDQDGLETTVDQSIYGYDTESEPGRVYLKPGMSWGVTSLQAVSGIQIQFIAGWTPGTGDDPVGVNVPEDIREWLKQATCWLYFNRNDAPDLNKYPVHQLSGVKVYL